MTIDSTDIQMIGDYYEQLVPIKCDKLNEMDKLFLHYLHNTIIIHKRHK